MQVELKKVRLNKTFKDSKTGKDKHIISYALQIGNKLVFIKPIHIDSYAVLDSFATFTDLVKKD